MTSMSREVWTTNKRDGTDDTDYSDKSKVEFPVHSAASHANCDGELQRVELADGDRPNRPLCRRGNDKHGQKRH